MPTHAESAPASKQASKLYITAVLAVFLLTAALRLGGLGQASLSHDEAWRADYSYFGGLDEARRVPPMQHVLGWATQHVFGRTELVLRIPYALAGIAGVIVLFLFARRHLDDRAALLIAGLAAAHPILVRFSRREKVFSLEALMCAVLLWAGLEAYRKRTAGSLYLFMAFGVVGLSITFTSSLVIAAWIPVLAWVYLRRDKNSEGPRRAFWITTAVLAVAGAAWFEWCAGGVDRAMVVVYYDEVLQMWPSGYTIAELAYWFLGAFYGASTYVLAIHCVWPPLNWCIGTLEILAITAALGVLWKRCRPLCIMVIILSIEVVLAGATRFWPFGKNHTMVFLIPVALIAVGCGMGELTRRIRRSTASVFLVMVVVLIPMARSVKGTLISPKFTEHSRPAFKYVESNLGPDDSVFIYYACRDAYFFYWSRKDVPVLLQARFDRDNFPSFVQRFDLWIKEHRRVWFVHAKNWKNEGEEWIGHLKARYRLLDEFRIADASALLFELPAGKENAASRVDGMDTTPPPQGESEP